MDKKVFVSNVARIFKPYKINVIMVSITMIFTSIGSFFTPYLTQQLIDLGVLKGEFTKTFHYVFLIIIIFILQQAFEFLQFIFYSKICVKLPYDLNKQACKHILKIRIKYYKEKNFSTVISEIFQDIANISSLTDSHFLGSFVSLFKIIFGIIALLAMNWKLTIIMLFTIPLRVGFSQILYKKQTKIVQVIMKVQSKFSSWLGDSISGVVEIRLWSIINKKLNEVKEILSDSVDQKRKLLLWGQIDSIFSGALNTVFTCVLYLLGAVLINNGELTLGGLVAFISYSALVLTPITIVSYLITQLSSIIPALVRYTEFLNAESEEDLPGSVEIDSDMDIQSISFNDVTFKYDEINVLEDICFEIKKGEKVAIIGSNGSGKTTIINLLLGFYTPTTGDIKINNRNINEYTLNSYRNLYSLMAQNNYMFNNTIENNINLTGLLSMQEIIESCKLTGAYEFINNLSKGFETVVGFNGSKLSGGQRQKITLSRALARKAKILILDEATSNYDHNSELNFNQNLINLNKYQITIIITHRPEILQNLDKIIYLDNGKVLEVDTYENIYQRNENFRNMISANLKGEL